VIRALIFDVDGTLADTEDAHRRAFNSAFEAYGLDWRWSPDEYEDLLRITGGKERIGAYISRLNIDDAQQAELTRLIPLIHSNKTHVFTELVRRGAVPLRSGIRRLVSEARAAGVALAIASTTTFQNVKALLTASFGADALQWFDTIATGDVVRHKKPAPDIYFLVLAALGMPARDAVAFEDSALGVQAARAAGVFTVATPSRWTAAQSFKEADIVLPSLGDPDAPLCALDAQCIGANYLGLKQIEALHAAAMARIGETHVHTR
jgi:HAD superfamily hydrolase (TIGR01509 family)